MTRQIILTLAPDTTETECGSCDCITEREQCGAFGQKDLDNNAEGTFLRLPECIAAEHPALPVDRFDCLKCGPAIPVDEDGCCAQCGQSAVTVKNGKPLYGEPDGCNICGTRSADEGVRAVGKYRACLGCDPAESKPLGQMVGKEIERAANSGEDPPWREKLRRLWNGPFVKTFCGWSNPLTVDDLGRVDEDGMHGQGIHGAGTRCGWSGISADHRRMVEALWPLEQLRRVILSGSGEAAIPFEVSGLCGEWTLKASSAGLIAINQQKALPVDRDSFLEDIDMAGSEILANEAKS